MAENSKTTTNDPLNRLRTLCREDIQFLAQSVLGYRDISIRTHGPIFRALSEPTKRKLFCLPRGSFKSSIVSIAYPIWLLINDPDTRILLDSELYTNAKNLLREIRHHLESAELTTYFGEFRSQTWNEGEITVKQRKHVRKEASITCGGIETTKVGQHYDVIICDDMNSDNNSQTQEGRQKIITHYRMLTSILEPGGVLVIVGTRYASNDLIGWVMENEIDQKAIV